MENNMGVHVHCGSYRPKWMRGKRKRTALHFDFSLEVPEEMQSEVVAELSESIHELVSRWSRSCYIKMKREAVERKELK